MASGLKSKLSMMAQQGGASKRPVIVRHPMSRHYFEKPVDGRLFALDERALSRIGYAGAAWPGAERCVFLDTETTGLSRGAGTIAFLVGIGYVRGDSFTVEQWMVGDYPDEPVMLRELRERLAEFDVVVSFNGNAFDLPLLESRAVMCRMPPLFESVHKLDLMHPARRLWKRRLASCRLGELEARVLGAGRENDLPGSEAPKRFFDYLKCGDRSLLDEVLLHNRLDIESLESLLIRLCEAYAQPEQQAELIDLFSMGVAMERRGERELAELCYKGAMKPRTLTGAHQLREQKYVHQARLSLSMMKKRAGDMAQAEQLWISLADFAGAAPLIELSKFYEHHARDVIRALEHARRALAVEQDPAKRQAIERRIRRLVGKL